jgi:excisionase family DNA binding protein
MRDGHPSIEQGTGTAAVSPWLTVPEAAARVNCGPKTIYREVKAGRLRAARVGGRRELRFLAAWVDDWLIGTSEPFLAHPGH